jgi:sugar O-acyltransferase (sialic acid O-acetyltransferase NeuD family)
MRPILLVGGGGHCKSVIDAAESAGLQIKGILDVPEHVGEQVLSYKIIGTDCDIPKYVKDCDFIVTLGFIKNPDKRVSLHEQILSNGGHLGIVIARTANVSKYAEVEAGSVILHQTNINAGAHIGRGCIINTFANIEHDAVVGDYSHISTGSMVNGDCKVGERVFLGSQSVMVNGISITSDCIIAAGSVVRKDINIRGIYAGNPATIRVRFK